MSTDRQNLNKVFRPSNISGQTKIDWQESSEYGSAAIGEIVDPEGALSSKEITSIPSPWARIDLVKTAFKEVLKPYEKAKAEKELSDDECRNLLKYCKDANGRQKSTIYHRLVSEVFDVAQIFFNWDTCQNVFEIIVWNRNGDIDRNNDFGKTLDLFLQSDALGDDPYNFNELNSLYILNYIGEDKPAEMNIVGATSPATMFFSSANDLSYVSKNISFGGQHRPFDDKYQPLYERDFEFVKYFFLFRKRNNRFSRCFPEMDSYLEATYRVLTDQQKREIDALAVDSLSGDLEIKIENKKDGNIQINDEQDGNSKNSPMVDAVKILGNTFHKRTPNNSWKSDFEIKSNIFEGDKKPLVLPIVQGNLYADFRYTNDCWGTNNNAPYFDTTDWKDRELPIVRTKYPYLTISDFLADTIVRTPYQLNSISYYDGGYKGEDCSYLLPLSELFFKFFTAQELIENESMLTIKDCSEGVQVHLRIPVAKNNGKRVVEYSRVYRTDGNIAENVGTIVDLDFGLGIMPLIRFPNDVAKEYRIAFFDNNKNTRITLNYYAGNKLVENTDKVVRCEKGSVIGCYSYRVKENFDSIQVKLNDEISGFLCPKFGVISEDKNEKYTFAVDFGTTNTHIEYCTSSNPNPRPFEILEHEKQLIQMHQNYDSAIRLGFVRSFIPAIISKEDTRDSYEFPMRTVYATKKGIRLDAGNLIPFGDGNIPFLHERRTTPEWDRIFTDIKWADNNDLLRLHLETIFIMLRNKVLLNGGNLSDTQILWFYPASMLDAKVAHFNQIWRAAYEKYFGEKTSNVVSLSESAAPYFHYITSQGAAEEIVTIDVGGGTTDIFVVENSEAKMLMSFRFASNAIFGDGYNSNPSQNGFVCKYVDSIRERLEHERLDSLKETLNQIESMQKSSDIISFLFSLVGEKVKHNDVFNFLKTLEADDKMRYIFIIFYGSIIYYLARAMKYKGLQKPKTIAFSGNGAKTLHVLSPELSYISEFFKLIFDEVYNDNTGVLDVKIEKNPKVATCKGGIEKQIQYNISDLKYVFVEEGFNSELPDPKYQDVTNDVKDRIVKSVQSFLQCMFNLHENNNRFLVVKLGADSSIYQSVKDKCLGDFSLTKLNNSINAGFNRKFNEVANSDKLEETLFFYPLIGFLHDLAYEISKM